MAEEDSSQGGEKEFDASEQKRRQAREEGNIPQSKETNTFVLFLGIVVSGFALHMAVGNAIYNELTSVLSHPESYSRDIFEGDGGAMGNVIMSVLLWTGALIGIVFVMVIVALVVQQAITISFNKIVPKPDNLNPLKNLKKKYGPSGLFDFGKDTVKMAFIAIISTIFMIGFANRYYAASAVNLNDFAGLAFAEVMKLVGIVAVFQLVLAMIDFPVQRLMYANRLKMTREEMKKEMKQSEGDPHFKQARREKGSKISRGQMLQNVKDATVVMVNPEHYAVALKWDPDGQQAPVCVAKGVDHLAARIREVAMASNVPIYRDPPATRSIYALVEIDEEIRPEHFAAVAAAIQYVGRVTKHQ